MADAIQNIRLAYRALLQNDSQLSHLRKKLADGDLAALQKYSMRAGQLAVNALKESAGNESIDRTFVKEALDSVFRENYDAVVNASTAAQKAQNEASGIGLNASVSDYSDENVQALADRVISHEDLSEGISSITNDIVVQSQRYADDSERRSAEFENDSGLEVLVTREYDDVGVHTTDKDGGKPCQWCLDRCGTDVPYQEAYEKGMFERHPGCGCIITYKTKKGIYRQGKGDWSDNSWNEVHESERNKRIDFSNSISNQTSQSKWKNEFRSFFEEKVKSGEIKDKINIYLQKKHLEGNNNGRSYIYGDEKRAEQLYKKLHFTGEPVIDKNGNWTHKERVEDDQPIGVKCGRDGYKEETNKAMIVYSKTGSHIYPR